jgi:hypothetical protein
VSDLDTSPELREIALLTTGATYVQADALIEIADRSSGVIVIAVLATVVDGRAVTEIVNRGWVLFNAARASNGIVVVIGRN